MDLLQHAAEGCSVETRFLTMSDGVELQMFEFSPPVATDRPPLLFVAGWISQVSGWTGVLKSLTAKYPVHYLETREKRSSKVLKVSAVAFDMHRMRDDVAEVIQQCYPDGNYLLSGSSLGASAIVEFLLMHKLSPNATALIAPNPELKLPKGLMHGLVSWFPPALYAPIKAIAKWYLRSFRLDPVKEPEQYEKYASTLDAADPYKLKPNAMAMLDYHVWDRLAAVQNKVLIVGASSDKLHGLDNLLRMTSLMPNATLVSMESNKATHSEQAGSLLAGYFNGESLETVAAETNTTLIEVE
jgi:pimeloyl-ACP methyl ester carboxylesterase